MNPDRPRRVLENLSRFLLTDFDELMAERLAADPRDRLLALFRRVVEQVPAYRRLLLERSVNPDAVADFAAYERLPLTTKPDYMQAFDLPERCAGGELTACEKLAVSSGSTGTPTFWPRASTHELDVALRFEQVFRHSFRAHERKTLAVVCFPLGNWVGGVYTASCCWLLAQKGYPVTVATPGNKADEIIRVVRELGPYFEQTVLLGYPPFVKDVLDTGRSQGMDWSSYRIKFVFAGEVFSEEWRELMGERVGSTDPCRDSASLYGTADGGVLGNETPLSIAIRRFLAQTPDAARALFGESRLPTLVQYDPSSRYFEVVDDTLVVSGDNGVPLIRYHIADRGGVISHDDLRAFLESWGVDSLEAWGLPDAEATLPLPFVWVFGRADFTVSYYGANIYPENVTVGLERAEFRPWVSGKFVMETRHDASENEFLRITVELLPDIQADEEKAFLLAHSIQRELLRLNSEFANYVPTEKQTPSIALRAFGDTEYFPIGVKHRYTRKGAV
ncbi:phenylacetate--CoA ligase family protein [Methylococcus sp. EFPC2]|uniref:phenylacetate--CoA ligase family protein n=1 Tax=Methylococcus sp. EFPC2 TaxID=2812648 RepID=UPI001968741A|nr:phenylacetate--CoA ligase family protein [Methylococcus sp. EFPC2]QSA96498.1 phenylacetate--CoA ligase family protein [Methylococcus sp. EFPC2]